MEVRKLRNAMQKARRTVRHAQKDIDGCTLKSLAGRLQARELESLMRRMPPEI